MPMGHMLARTDTGRLVLAAVLGLCACKGDEGPPSTEPLEIIPADIQGIYGRTVEDAPGLRVTASGLVFDQLALTIHAGAMEGDTVRVERATLAWENLEPKLCTGTIARQGDRLLINLYEIEGGQDRCESTLEAAWSRWEPRADLPELIRGRYGNLLIEPEGMRLDIEWVSTTIVAGGIFELPGTNDERVDLLISEAKLVDPTGVLGDFECGGTMKLEAGQLTTSFSVAKRLVPAIGSAADKDEAAQAKLAENREICERWSGSATKWTIDPNKLPKSKVSKGLVSASLSGSQAALEAPDLSCTVPLWRTESVPSDAYGDPAAGGEAITLGKAEPTRVGDACKLKIRIWCERAAGNPIDSIDPDADPEELVSDCIDDQTRDLCPDVLYLKTPGAGRYKLGAGPDSFNEIACVDLSGEFRAEP